MDFKEYQQKALRTAKRGEFQFDLSHATYGLAGEAGEFVDAVKKHQIYGQELNKENLLEEIGDLLWYAALAAEILGSNLNDIAENNVMKLQKRYPEKYTDLLAKERLDKI
jgi:NTP pyrophosphatase (non-canonical NTP hydrolase)